MAIWRVLFPYCLFQPVYHLYKGRLLFISCRSSLVEFLGSLMYANMSSAISDIWTSCFLICIPLIFFWCLIALARILSTILDRYRKNGQPYLVPNFSGIASSISPFNLILADGLLYIAFIMLRWGFWNPDLSNTFNKKGCWIFQILFQHLMRWSCDFWVCLYRRLN